MQARKIESHYSTCGVVSATHSTYQMLRKFEAGEASKEKYETLKEKPNVNILETPFIQENLSSLVGF